MSLPVLSRHVAAKLNRPAPELDQEITEDISIVFAPHDAVAVQCRDGRLTLALSLER